MKIKKLTIILYNVIVPFLIFMLFEVYIEILLNNPKYIPDLLLPKLREYYMTNDRKIIQFRDECSVYDSTLYYTLRPGHFIFSNREFDNEFEVNEIGVRDDETSLDRPEIIILGDSFAMGWGVDQDKTFASLLEKNLKYKVLNTGISSYGTAREFTLLNNVNTNNLKFLIIQYCPNDYSENKDFFNNKNRINISSQDSYLTICENHRKSSKYFLFKHTIKFSGLILKKFRNKFRKKVNHASKPKTMEIDEFSAFLNVIIDSIEKIPANTEIIVFCIDARKSEDWFVKGIKDKLEEKKYSDYKERITLLDLSSDLDESHYFILDDHINQSGHQVIENKLEKLIMHN